MTIFSSPPELSDGAYELLFIADENDENEALANNMALQKVLEFSYRLIHFCQNNNKDEILKLFDIQYSPKHFLAFTAASLQNINKHIDERDLSVPDSRDFDHYVLQGYAQALADLVWIKRKKDDYNGPSLDECISKLAQHKVETFCTLIIQHYLANILQYYFVAMKVREAIRNLDPKTEVGLRQKETRAIADYIIQIAKTENVPGKAHLKIINAFQIALDRILIEEEE